jgi:coproporphyrinogen III oxidase-like Fe-S oxidoreductase
MLITFGMREVLTCDHRSQEELKMLSLIPYTGERCQYCDVDSATLGKQLPAVFLHAVPTRAEESRAEPSQSTLVAKEQ